MAERYWRQVAVVCVGGVALAGTAVAKDLKLPKTLVTTAYNTGTSGYSQMVAVGSMLKNKHGVNLRVLPGKNDVSRLSPVKKGTAQFTATGSDSVYAQEAVYTFGKKAWGPMAIRLLLVNRSGGCTNFAVAKDVGVKTMADLKGKRVAWVRGSPALQKATESLLAFADLKVADVKKVEVGGWAASINGIINGDIDAAITATQSTFMLKMQGEPARRLPSADPACRRRRLGPHPEGRAVVRQGLVHQGRRHSRRQAGGHRQHLSDPGVDRGRR